MDLSLLFADTAETLATGNEQAILAIIAVILGGVIALMAAFIVSRETSHKKEMIGSSKEHAASLEKVYTLLATEKEERRKDQTETLKEVLKTGQAMCKSLDQNTGSTDRLIDLVERRERDGGRT